MKNLLHLLLLTSAVSNARLPETEIFLSDITKVEGRYTFTQPVNITNSQGYDNQPYFTRDGRSILFTSGRDTSQTDIFSYDLNEKSTQQLTMTSESEYSPLESADGHFISTVRVDSDSGQRLYLLPKHALSQAVLLDNSEGIGYHCWLNDSLIAMFVLGNPHRLEVLNIKDGRRTYIGDNPGRCMRLSPDKSKMYFIQKPADSTWNICELVIADFKTRSLMPAIKNSEDFEVLPAGEFLMGSEGLLYMAKPGYSDWSMVADFRKQLKDFYRLSVSRDGRRLALVAFTGEKP